MPQSHIIRNVGLAAAAMLFASCAGTGPQTGEQPVVSDEELRNTDMDVLFATEFPVASKAEAIASAKAAWEEGDVERALFFYVRALQFDPGDVELLTGIASIHRQQGNAQLAARAFTMALHLDPYNDRALEGRGLLLFSHNEFERATADLEKAVQFSSKAWRANNVLGVLADRRSDHSAAQAHYNAALQVVPKSPVVLNNRGHSRFLAGDLEAAIEDLKYVATEHDYEPAWLNLGAVYAAQRKYEQAAQTYRHVLSEAKSDNKVAEFAIEHEDYDTATQLLERAIFASPTYFPEAEENLARIRVQVSAGEIQ